MKKIFLVIAILVCIGSSAYAQPTPQVDPIGEALFSPELIMQNQQAISLTEGQRKAIMDEVQKAQSEFMDMHWGLQKEVETFTSILSKTNIDETAALRQLERILDAEDRIKRRQITLMIRIKNTLTAEQQSKLNSLKKG